MTALETENRKFQHSVNAAAHNIKSPEATETEPAALRRHVANLETKNKELQDATDQMSMNVGAMESEKQRLQDASNRLSVNAEAL